MYSDWKFGDTYGNMEDRKYTKLPEWPKEIFRKRIEELLLGCSYYNKMQEERETKERTVKYLANRNC